MKLNLVGQGVEITDAIRSYFEKKLGRLERLFKGLVPEEVELRAAFKKERAEYRVEVDLFVGQRGEKVHVWDADPDLYAAVDKVIDELERVLVKDKEKAKAERRTLRREKLRRAEGELGPAAEPAPRPPVEEELLAVEKPMSVEDALLELEEKNLQFLPFVEVSGGELCILYRKKAGNYGLIRTGCRSGLKDTPFGT
ncbi:MAG: ribosome-associated translation inhibitor RaiA [Aquificae bacterium]|nr:ribosome-associated translation inhibitor RaiA [Aquificota bacterium]